MSGTLTQPTVTNYLSGSGMVTGTDANDQISGGPGDDVLNGGAGDDILYGDTGDDTLIGGPGNDFLFGGDGNNVLDGGPGNDVLYGGAGNDVLITGTGNDTVFGAGGINTAVLPETYLGSSVNYNYGSPLVSGTAGSDTMYQIGAMRFLDGTLAYDPGSDVGQAYRLYQAAFERTPDVVGLGFWTNALDNGATLTDVAQGFLTSTEFQGRYGALNDQQFVSALYQNVLGRAPDASGQAYWLGQLKSGTATRAQVLVGFSESTENYSNTSAPFASGVFAPSPDAVIATEAYQSILGRAPDAGGLTTAIQQLQNGVGEDGLVAGLLASAEFQARPGAQSTAGFVGLLEQDVGGGTSAAQTAAYVNGIDSGAFTRTNVGVAFVQSQQEQANAQPLLTHGFAI